jgi:hypothetical protein
VRIRIRAARFTFLALAAALPAAGCHTLQPSTPIAVNVRDAETHAPVPDATVRLWRFGAHESDRESAFTAGPDGVAHARLAPPDVGGVMVEVTGPNCLSAQVPLPRAVADALATAKPLQPYKGPPLSVDVDVFAGPRPKVELVLPPGYRGVVKAEVRVSESRPWPAGQRLFSYTVPAGGAVRVDGPAVFGHGYGPEVVAKFLNGAPCPSEPKGDEVGLRWIRRDGSDIYFAVGTRADESAARRALGALVADNTGGSESRDRPGGRGSGGGRRGGMGGRGGRMGGR